MNRGTAILGVALLATCIKLAALPAQQAPTNGGVPQPAGASVRFAFGGDVAQIPAEFIDHLVFLPVHVNHSAPSLFEFDSTAEVSSVDPDRAAELGLTNLQSAVLNLSGVDISLPALAETARKGFGAQVGRSYEGTIGGDVLAGMVVEIDYARKTVRLYDPATYQYSGRGKSFPLKFVDGKPVVQAKVKVPSGKSAEGDFVVNTALDAPVLISVKHADARHLFSSHLKTIPATDSQTAGTGNAVVCRLNEFQIGPYTVAGALAEFSREDEPASSDAKLVGEIGGGMLRRFAVVLDYSHQLMYLDPNGDFRDDDLEDMSGISVIASGPGLKTFEVTQVAPGTPGADAGIHAGDVIAGINDEPGADLTLADVRNLFRQVGHSCKLLIERNGQTLTISIKLRRRLL